MNSSATIVELSGLIARFKESLMPVMIIVDLLTMLAMFVRNLLILAISRLFVSQCFRWLCIEREYRGRRGNARDSRRYYPANRGTRNGAHFHDQRAFQPSVAPSTDT